MKKNLLHILVLLFTCASFVSANDTSGQLLSTGEIRFEKQDGIVLKHEALLLSDTVTVDYLFENITDKPVETTVFFPIPNLGPVVPYYEYPHDFKFRVWSNGKEIKPELSRKITIKDTDVTKYFNMIGIDSYHKAVIADFADSYEVLVNVAEPLRKLPLAEQKKLEELGMLSKGCLYWEDDTNCDIAFTDYNYATILQNDPDFFEKVKFEVSSYIDRNSKLSPQEQVLAHYPECKDQLLGKSGPKKPAKCLNDTNIYHLSGGFDAYKQEAMYYWKQTFPPHKTVHIRHTYKPSFLGNSIGGPSEAVTKQLNWSYEKNRQGYWTESSYIITTANNWKTPIEKFDLLVWGPKGAAISYGKGENSKARIAPKNYLLETKQDFVPVNEISFELAYQNGNESYESRKEDNKTLPQLYRIDGPANVRIKPNGKKIKTLENGVYIWAYPVDKKDWFIVLLDEKTTGYTHKNNLIPFGKLDK